MSIKKLTILGKSDATITMILDNLESIGSFPLIDIVNNQKEPITHPFENDNFNIKIIDDIISYENFFLGTYKPQNKKIVFNLFKQSVSLFINIIHKSSQISNTTSLGNGVLINPLVSIAAKTKIGNFVGINRNVSIGHHVILNDFVTINPGVNISGFVEIGDGTMVGVGSNIIDGIKIGNSCIIGAGSVVTKDIPDNVLAYGNPCKIIKENNIL
jgi:sugar O-acyltransferase (sialic acid O-acetyltransferase NeuD family)